MPKHPEKYEIYYANRRVEKTLAQLPPKDFKRIDAAITALSVIILAFIHCKDLEKYLRKARL